MILYTCQKDYGPFDLIYFLIWPLKLLRVSEGIIIFISREIDNINAYKKNDFKMG